MRLHLLTLLAALSPYALAVPVFTYPAAGDTVAAGSVVVKWDDSSDSPSITDLTTYTLQLFVGGNTDATALLSESGDFSTGDSYTLDITAALAGSTTNGFYLGMIAVATAGGTYTAYSDRFTMSGMTGTTPTADLTAITALDGATAGPANIDSVTSDTTTAAAADTGDEYTVPYYLQTGLTKYAPMQPVPGTTITATSYSALYPTSAYTLATTYMAEPTIVLTVTESQTYSVSSIENTAAAAALPSDDGSTAKRLKRDDGDMKKFLARWKD